MQLFHNAQHLSCKYGLTVDLKWQKEFGKRFFEWKWKWLGMDHAAWTALF